jgi:RNA polymerase sigma-70 factor, ECF subfamily
VRFLLSKALKQRGDSGVRVFVGETALSLLLHCLRRESIWSKGLVRVHGIVMHLKQTYLTKTRAAHLKMASGTLPRMSYPSKLAKTQQDPWEEESESKARADYLERLQAGDKAAWEQFLAKWNPLLYSYVSYNLRGADEADDIVGETLLALVPAIRNFDGNVSLSTFVYSIAYRKVVDYWRARQVTFELPEWLSTAGPSDISIELYEALAKLPEPGQQVLLLRYHAGLSVAEIADILGRSYKATESLLSRVRRQFESLFLGDAEA